MWTVDADCFCDLYSCNFLIDYRRVRIQFIRGMEVNFKQIGTNQILLGLIVRFACSTESKSLLKKKEK